MNTSKQPDYGLAELNAEAALGGPGEERAREIRQIDMADFPDRRAAIADALWAAATETGFFQVFNHGIPQADIDEAFAYSERFFGLPQAVKAQYPMRPGTNHGWEFKAQVRPSTGTADQKESYQITLPHMAGMWPSEAELAGFRAVMERFERQNWQVAMAILSCFALKLDFDEDFFTERHDPSEPTYQSTLRLLHYLPLENATAEDLKGWRAGAHTDFDCLSLLHQRPGQGGLQVCPGRESATAQWTSIAPTAGMITCNIGDMLKRWSDDRLLSTLHRVRMPRPDEYQGPRYSIAFFAQANTDRVIQGPEQRYAPITARDFLHQRIAANFSGKG